MRRGAFPAAAGRGNIEAPGEGAAPGNSGRRRKSERIEIVHIDLDRPGAAVAQGSSGAQVLVVFWRSDVPVGQAYTCRDNFGGLCVPEMVESRLPAARNTGRRGAIKEALSVVICTRDRPDALRRCLASLANQTAPPGQILVVDNAPGDPVSKDIARAFGVDYVREDRPGLDHARNRGVREARGDIIAFIDDDVTVHPAWAEHMLAAFDANVVMAVTGLVLPAELETPAQVIFEKHWGFGRGFERIDFTPVFLTAFAPHVAPTWKIGAGANMAFRREIFERAGYFDERLDAGAAGCGGDSEFWYRVLARGWWCRYEPSAAAFHHHRREDKDLARQIRAYMRGHVATLLVQYERYHDRRNLRRIFITLPGWYGAQLLKRMRSGKTGGNAFVWQEIEGSIAGVLYYLRSPRSKEVFRVGRRTDMAGRPDGEVSTAEEPVQSGPEELVSVIIPAFNAANTIGETLRSVCEQSYRNLEIIVVDDGSADGTPDLVRKLQCRDPRIRLIRQPNGGVAAARNRGIAEARGEFVAPIDADDLWRPTKIGKQMSAMRRLGEDCGLVYTWYALIDGAGRIVSRKHKPIEEGDALTRMCRGNVVGNGSGALMRKRAVVGAGLYDASLRARNAQGCEDLKLYFQIAERHLFAVVREHLTGYRRIDDNMSSDVLQMEHSNRLVIAEFEKKYPQHAGLFKAGRANFLKWIFVRAVRLRKPHETWVLARKMLAVDRAFALKTIFALPVTLGRGWIVPRLKWLVKSQLGWNTDPVLFLKPAGPSGGVRAAPQRQTAPRGLLRDVTTEPRDGKAAT